MASSHYKLDLHTHSIRSHDGSVTKEHYKELIEQKVVDYIAVTDHNAIDYAVAVQQELGQKIIIGEEVWTAEGEVIGLFLQKAIPRDLSLEKTFALIKEQNGLIYIPHPFCHNRFGVKKETLLPLIDQVDIMEYFNPRNIFRADNEHAREFILHNRQTMAASSDSHCWKEIGGTYTTIHAVPTRANLVLLLQNAMYACRYPAKWHFLCPKRNKLKKKLHIL
jgi:predicted metal-dependent phosphoesterase TrpH